MVVACELFDYKLVALSLMKHILYFRLRFCWLWQPGSCSEGGFCFKG